MKKLLLGLLCIGSMVALPGCWCCRRACEEPCENYCDDSDDYCDQGHYRCGDDGYEEQQGHRTYRKDKSEGRGPRKVMFREVDHVNNPVRTAEQQGLTCTFPDKRYHVENKRANKAEAMNGSKRQARKIAQETMEVSAMEDMTEK